MCVRLHLLSRKCSNLNPYYHPPQDASLWGPVWKQQQSPQRLHLPGLGLTRKKALPDVTIAMPTLSHATTAAETTIPSPLPANTRFLQSPPLCLPLSLTSLTKVFKALRGGGAVTEHLHSRCRWKPDALVPMIQADSSLTRQTHFLRRNCELHQPKRPCDGHTTQGAAERRCLGEKMTFPAGLLP